MRARCNEPAVVVSVANTTHDLFIIDPPSAIAIHTPSRHTLANQDAELIWNTPLVPRYPLCDLMTNAFLQSYTCGPDPVHSHYGEGYSR